MISVVIIGQGNVAYHLVNVFTKAKSIDVKQINSRKLNNIPKADVTIIAVSDDVIAEVSSKIKNSLVVHTSGNVAMKSLKNRYKKGVFYPLQSFSKDKKVNFKKVPFCIEAENNTDLKLLEKIAKAIGKKVYYINSEQRKSIHVSAVFVNNFVNHLYKIAEDICIDNNVSFKVLQPLIQETANKIKKISPKEAQTGPAIRNDKNTIKEHLKKLHNHQQEIYTLLTESIQKNGREL